MCEEQVLEGERDAVPHHLALRPLPAIEQQSFPFPNDGEGADPPFHGGAGGGGSKEADEQGHLGNIGGSNRSPAQKCSAKYGNAAPCLREMSLSTRTAHSGLMFAVK